MRVSLHTCFCNVKIRLKTSVNSMHASQSTIDQLNAHILKVVQKLEVNLLHNHDHTLFTALNKLMFHQPYLNITSYKLNICT